MAVVGRKRKSGVTYYAVNEWHGRQQWEKVGTSKREAEIRDRAMKREIEAGEYHPTEGKRSVTVSEYVEFWASRRTNVSAPDERRILRLYALSRPWFAGRRLDEVKPTDVDRLVRELKDERKDDGTRRLSDKTIANLVGVLRVMFGAAVRADICIRNPVTLEPGLLRRRPAEEQETYSAAEVAVLTRHHAIPWPIRVLNALALFTGMREGEVCGRRWSDLDDGPKPLAALTIRSQYGGLALKTDRPRVAPVHPELAEILTKWATEGFELYTGRLPTPDDFIVPNKGRRSKKEHHTRSSYYKAFVRSAEAAGVRPRSLHATRHTFISLCRRGGARAEIIERVTHNAAGKIIDRYTHFDWVPVCDAVLCLRLDVHQDMQLGTGSRGEFGGELDGIGRSFLARSAQSTVGEHGSIPRASTGSAAKNGSPKKPRQDSRQEFREELSAANRRRKRRLLALNEVDPDAAAPGLAACRGLEAAYRVGDGDQSAEAELVNLLTSEARRR